MGKKLSITLGCLAVLVALAVWWNGDGEKIKNRSPTIEKEAAPADPGISRRSLGEWLISLGFSTTERRVPSAGLRPKDVEEAVRATFLAYNRQDLQNFLNGWTDNGFQRAYEIPKERAKHFGLLGSLSFRPYALGSFFNTEVYDERNASTDVDMTYGDVQESHRMSLVWEEDGWKIEHDEKLPQLPRDATVVDVKLQYYKMQLNRTRATPGNVAFRITNADTHQHEFVVKKMNPDSGTEDNVGLIPPLEPGQHETLILKLEPGRYVVLCNLLAPDMQPYSTGMRNEFIVQ